MRFSLRSSRKGLHNNYLRLLAALVSMWSLTTVASAIPTSAISSPLYTTGFYYLSVGLIAPNGTVNEWATLPSGHSPNAMTIDSHDNILVALGSGKIGGDVIAEVTSSGAVSNYAAGLTTVSGLAFDASGNLYVLEETHGKVIKIAPNGTQTTFATVPNEAEGRWSLTQRVTSSSTLSRVISTK